MPQKFKAPTKHGGKFGDEEDKVIKHYASLLITVPLHQHVQGLVAHRVAFKGGRSCDLVFVLVRIF